MCLSPFSASVLVFYDCQKSLTEGSPFAAASDLGINFANYKGFLITIGKLFELLVSEVILLTLVLFC